MATTPEELAAIARSALRSLLPPSDAMIEAAAKAVYTDETKSTGQNWAGCHDTDREYFGRQACLALTAAIRAAIDGGEG